MSDTSASLDLYAVPVVEYIEARVFYYCEGTTPEEAKAAAERGEYVSRKTTTWTKTLQHRLGRHPVTRVED